MVIAIREYFYEGREAKKRGSGGWGGGGGAKIQNEHPISGNVGQQTVIGETLETCQCGDGYNIMMKT